MFFFLKEVIKQEHPFLYKIIGDAGINLRVHGIKQAFVSANLKCSFWIM